jgi:hypothetical protein
MPTEYPRRQIVEKEEIATPFVDPSSTLCGQCVHGCSQVRQGTQAEVRPDWLAEHKDEYEHEAGLFFGARYPKEAYHYVTSVPYEVERDIVHCQGFEKR